MATLDSLIPIAPDQSDSAIGKTNFAPSPSVSTSFEDPRQKEFTLNDWANQDSSLTTKLTPETFDWDKTNAGEYVDTKNYKSLGFDPLLGEGNELKYHQMQTGLDVAGDVIKGFSSNLAHGFGDMVGGWKDTAALLTGGGFGEAFKQSAIEEAQKRQQDRENGYHIYTDPTDKSFFSWDSLAKSIQEAGGIVGAGAEIVGEQALVMAGIALSFGTAAPIEGVIAPMEALRFGEVVGETAKIINTLDKTSAIRGAYDTFKESKSFSNLYDIAKQGTKYAAGITGETLSDLGTGFLPGSNSLNAAGTGNVIEAIKSKNASAILGSIGRGFGAFYNDVRDINLAVSMGQGGASSTYQEQLQKQTDAFKLAHGEDPGGIDLKNIQDNAYKAAKTDGALNATVAFYTNKLAFGNLLKGSKAVQEQLLANTPGEFSNLVRGTSEKEFKATGDRLAIKPDKWDSFRNRAIRAIAGFKDPEMYGAMGLHGLGFGVQMSAQATVDDAIKSYYTAKYDHKTISATDALGDAINKQFTKQGAKTFISGFLTGAIISPILETGGQYIERRAQRNASIPEPKLPDNPTDEQKAIYEKDKAEWDDSNLKKNKAASDYVEKVNEQWKNPVAGLGDLILQTQWEEKINGGLVANDKKSVNDNKSDAAIEFFTTAARNGMIKPYLAHLDDKISQLSPEQLHDAIYANTPADQKPEFTEETHAETLQAINDFKEKAQDVSKIYKDLIKQFPYPINPSNYKLGTPEREAAQKIYDQHSRALGFLIYYKASIVDKVERQNKILYGDNVTGGIQEHLHDIPFYNVSTFASIPKMDEELELLKTLTGSESIPGNQKAYRYAKSQVESMTKYRDMVRDYIDGYNKILSDNDDLTRTDRIKDHNDLFAGNMTPVLKELIDNKFLELGKRPIDKETLGKVVNSYLDYHRLTAEHDNMLDTVNKIMDPKGKNDYFKTFINAENEAMTWEAYKAASEKPSVQPDNVTTPPKPTDTTKPVGEDIPFEDIPNEEPKPEEPKKFDENAIKAELLKPFQHHDVNEEDSVVDEPEGYSPELQRYLATNEGKDLIAKLQASHKTIEQKPISNVEKVDLQKKFASAIINDHFDHVQALEQHPELKGNPHVIKVKDKDFRVVIDGKEGTEVFPTAGLANMSLQDHITKEFPQVTVDGRTVRIGERLYDENGKEWRVARMKGEYMKLTSGNLTKEVKTLDGFTETAPTVAPTDTNTTTPPEKDYQKITKLRDQVQIYPHSAVGEKGISDTIRNTPVEDFKNSLSLTISKGPKAGTTIPIGDNPYVVQNREAWTLELKRDGQSLGFISAPNKYSFTFDDKSVATQDLTVDQWKKVYNTFDGDNAVSLRQFKEDNLKAHALETAISAHMKGKNVSTLSGKQLSSFIDIIPSTGGYDFINDKKVERPSVKDLIDNGNELLSILDNRTGQLVYGEPGHDLDIREPWNGMSNYRAIVKLPNGEKKWVELQGKVFSPAEVTDIINQVGNNFTELSKLQGKERLDLQKATNKLLRKIFIALEPNPSRISIEPQVSLVKGVPTMQVSYKFKDGSPIEGIPDSGILTIGGLGKDADKLTDFTNALQDTVNKYFAKKTKGSEDKYKIIIPQDAYRESFPQKFDEDTAMKLQSSVSKNITKSHYLSYEVKNSTIPEEFVPTEDIQEPTPIQGVEFKSDGIAVSTEPEKKEENFLKLAEQGNYDGLFDGLDDDYAEKVVPKGFTSQDIIGIDQFAKEIATILPMDILSIEDVGTVTDNLKGTHTTVGQFVLNIDTVGNRSGVIKTSDNAPYKWHEAFHGVLRMLLPQEKIEQLLKDAKKESPITPEKVNQFLIERPQFTGADESTIHNQIAEEYIADKFEDWKKDHKTRTSAGIKGFFAKLLNWIKAIWNKFRGNNLEALFYDINCGAYKDAKIQDNQFTEASISEPALKVIEVGTQKVLDTSGKEIEIPKNLSPQDGNQLSSAIAARYVQKVTAEPYHNKRQVLESILDEYKKMLTPKQQKYYDKLDTIKNPAQKVQFAKSLQERYNIFRKSSSRESIMEAVNEHLKIMGLRQQLEDDTFEDLINADVREAKSYDISADQIGGYENLPKEVRMYIGSTTFPYVDEFGNSELKDGVPLVQAVNAGIVYNGLLQTLEGCTSDNTIMQRMQSYKKGIGNVDTTAFIDRLFTESGFSQDETSNWSITKNQSLFQSVINTFRQYNTNPLFAEISPSQGSSRVIPANQQDSARTQFTQCSQAHDAVYLPRLTELNSKADKSTYAKGVLKDTWYKISEQIDTKKAKGSEISDDRLRDLSQEVSNNLKNKMGISLSPDLTSFSIVSQKNGDILTPQQKELMNAYRGKQGITPEDIDGIRDSMLKGENIFTNAEGVEEGAANRLMRIFAANSTFDQSVWTMTYTDPEGKRRFGSQKPTYNREAVQKLNDPDKITELQNSVDNSSFLLQSPDFLTLSDKNLLKVMDIAGLKQVFHTLTEGEEGVQAFASLGLEVNRTKGASFKHLSIRDYTAFTLAAYSTEGGKVQNGPDKEDYFFTTPVSLGPIAESATNNMVNLPVVHAIDTNDRGETRLSKEALDIYTEQVYNEVAKIQRVQKEIQELPEHLKVTDYHNSVLRGLKIIDTRNMLGDLAKEIEEGAKGSDEYSPSYIAVQAQIKKYWGKKVGEFIKGLDELGLIKVQGTKITNRLLPDFIFKGFRTKSGAPVSERNGRMNLSEDNVKHNLAQIYINNHLNSSGIRRVLYGDQSKAFKNTIDVVRKMKGTNGAGESMEFSVTAPGLGINHPLPSFHHALIPEMNYTSLTGEKKDEADGQMYMTAKGMRYMLFGFGELTKTQSDILDEIAKGSKKASELFVKAGGFQRGIEAFNSKKVVYADGTTHFKCTSLMLTKELTSIKVGSQWVARKGREDLHNLRVSMEKFETSMDDAGTPTIAFASTENSSKGLKYQLAPGVENIHGDFFHQYSSGNMRQQVKLPSNKMSMTDPNGLKFNILTEQDHTAKAPWLGKTIGEVAKNYQADTNKRILNSYHTKINSIFSYKGDKIDINQKIDPKEVTASLGNLYDQMKATQEATGTDSQTLEFMTTRNGEPVYDLNNPATVQKFAQMFLSHMGTGPLKEKIPGLSMVMASGYGMKVIREVHELDENGQPKRWTVHTSSMQETNPEEYQNVYEHSDPQKGTYTGLPTEGKFYVLDNLKSVYPEYNEKGEFLGYFTEAIRPAHFPDELHGKVSEALQYMIGTRIPWDDKHQATCLKVVDVLPAYYGSICVLPGLTDANSGSDKDGDEHFASMADTYTKNGKQIAYGTADTPEGQFGEFVQWQVDNNKDLQKLLRSDKVFSNEEFIASVLGDNTKDYRIEQAMKELKLPSTVSEFMEQGGEELNNGVLNNRILNEKIALLSNEHISGGGKDAIINQATDTSPVKSLVDPENPNSIISILKEKGVKDDAPIMKQLMGDKDLDISTIDGAAKMIDTAHEGKEDVGAAIISVMTGGLLQQHDIQGEGIFFNGKLHDSFGDTLTDKGVRKLSETSALANTMTDNLKDGGTAAKLGLTIDSVGVIGVMVMQGIPLKSAMLYMQQPAVRSYFKQLKDLNGTIKTEEERKKSKTRLLDDMIKSKLSEVVKQYDIKDGKIPEELLTKLNLTDDKLIDGIIDNGSDTGIQFKALLDIQTIQKETAVLTSMNKIMSLSKGYPASWEDFDKIEDALNKIGIVWDKEKGKYVPMDDETFAKSSIPIDVRNVFTKDHDIYANYLKQVGQLRELSKKVFIERTDYFNRVFDIVPENFDIRDNQKEEFNKMVKSDFTSYLTIKAFINDMKNSGIDTTGLSQSLLYGSDKAGEENIKNVIQRLRETLKGKNTNALISKFLRIVVPGETGNRDDIYKVISNSWAKLSDQQQQNLQDSFYSLYANSYLDKNGKPIPTRDDAMTLFYYLLIKDGGQFKSGSFVKVVPPFMFKSLSDSTKKVNDLLANQDYSDQKAIDVLGVPFEQPLNDFMRSYSAHIGNQFFVKSVSQPQGISTVTEDPEKKGVDWTRVKEFIPRPISIAKGEIAINLFNGIRPETGNYDSEGIRIIKPTGKFDNTEKELLAKNIKYLENAGFIVDTSDKGYKVKMPYSVQVQGARYELKGIGKVTDKTLPTQLIEKGENIPQGIVGKYQKADWLGSKGQWRGALYGLFGDPIQTTPAKGEQTVTNPGYSPVSTEDKEVITEVKTTPEPTPESDKSPIQKLSDTGTFTATDKNGQVKQYNDKGEVVQKNIPLNTIIPQDNFVSSSSMQQDLFGKTVNVKGINIISGSGDPLGAALTNPTTISKRKGKITKDYPVVFNEHKYPDAEAAYKDNKVDDNELAKQGKIDSANNDLMQEILIAKLQQHPQLVKGINERGGVQFLEASSHVGFGNRFEGQGKESAFINNLIEAFKEVTKEKPLSSQPSFSDMLAMGEEGYPEQYADDEQEDLSSEIYKKKAVTDWKKEIGDIMESKKLPTDKQSEWLDKARNIYKELQGKVDDNKILDKIKSCK